MNISMVPTVDYMYVCNSAVGENNIIMRLIHAGRRKFEK